MSPSRLRTAAYWGVLIMTLFVAIGAVAAMGEEEEASAPVARNGAAR